MRVKASLGGTFRGSSFRFLPPPVEGADALDPPGSRLLWPAAGPGICVLVASITLLPKLVAAADLFSRQVSRWELTKISGSIAPQLGQRTCPRGRSIPLPVRDESKPRSFHYREKSNCMCLHITASVSPSHYEGRVHSLNAASGVHLCQCEAAAEEAANSDYQRHCWAVTSSQSRGHCHRHCHHHSRACCRCCEDHSPRRPLLATTGGLGFAMGPSGHLLHGRCGGGRF